MLAPLRKHAQKPHFYVIVSPTSFSFIQTVECFLHFCFEVIEQVTKLSWLVAFSYDVGQIVCVFFVVATSRVRLSGKGRGSSQGWFQAAVCDNKLSVQYLFNDIIFFCLSFFTDFILLCGVKTFDGEGKRRSWKLCFLLNRACNKKKFVVWSVPCFSFCKFTRHRTVDLGWTGFVVFALLFSATVLVLF